MSTSQSTILTNHSSAKHTKQGTIQGTKCPHSFHSFPSTSQQVKVFLTNAFSMLSGQNLCPKFSLLMLPGGTHYIGQPLGLSWIPPLTWGSTEPTITVGESKILKGQHPFFLPRWEGGDFTLKGFQKDLHDFIRWGIILHICTNLSFEPTDQWPVWTIVICR